MANLCKEEMVEVVM
jgi:hypothetical protein